MIAITPNLKQISKKIILFILFNLKTIRAFQGPPIVPSLRYVVIIKSMLVTTFYSSVLPIGLLFCFFNLLVFYWIDKVNAKINKIILMLICFFQFLLLRRYALPKTLGANLSNEMVDVFIELTIAVFSIGCAAFEKIMYKTLSWFVIFQLVVTVFVFVSPIHLINDFFCPMPKKKYSGKKYEDVKLDFLNVCLFILFFKRKNFLF